MSRLPSLFDRVGVLRPLRLRDFRLLWLGQTISFVGDGVYIFAVAWLIYRDLDASPATFALVGAAWSLPQVLLLMATGALTDRLDRRHLMIAGDLLRLVAIAGIGALVLSDAVDIPILVALVFVYGAGQALFGPAFNSIIPMIVPEDLLVQANSIGQVVRPLSLIVVGPIVGALLVRGVGTGWAFVFDATTFAVSAVCVWLMRVRRDPSAPAVTTRLRDDIREGIRYVRSVRWLLMGLLGGMVSLFCVWGPWETLVPFVISRDLKGSELQLALVYGAGGVGSVIAGITLAQRGGLPRKPVTVMYVAWAIGMGMTAGFGLISAVWQGMVVALIAEASIGVLVVIWFTLLHRLVPQELLGRVTSLDWMITILGAPVSFLIVGPLAAIFGADAVLIVAGALGAAATIFFMTRRGALDPERDGSLAEPVHVSP
ncbi:MAG TPA: MFS transporter [Actinomycetota bacterium]